MSKETGTEEDQLWESQEQGPRVGNHARGLDEYSVG
jgi:hypothetical protein